MRTASTNRHLRVIPFRVKAEFLGIPGYNTMTKQQLLKALPAEFNLLIRSSGKLDDWNIFKKMRAAQRKTAKNLLRKI